MKKILTRLLLGQHIKGEPFPKRPKKTTVMPTSEMTLREWMVGGWSDFIHNNKKDFK